MQELAILANPRRKSRKGRKTRRSRRTRRNPELMLLSGNPRRRKARKARRHTARRKTARRRVRHNPVHRSHRRTSRRHYAHHTRRHHRRVRHNPGIEDAVFVNPRGKKVSRKRRAQIRKMAASGRSRKQIARFTRLSPGTISRMAHFRRGRKAGRRKSRRSVVVTVPKGYKVRRRVRRGQQFGFKINPKGGLFGNIGSNLVSAAFVAAGFIGSRFVANLLKGVMPSFLKHDLVTNAVVPVVLTFMPEKFPQKRALMGGAYLSWVMKLLGQVLPDSWKNQISGMDAYVTAQPSWMQVPDMSMFGYPAGGTDEWGRPSGNYVQAPVSGMGDYAMAVPGASPPVLSHSMQLSDVTRNPVPVIGAGMDEELEAEGMTGPFGY